MVRRVFTWAATCMAAMVTIQASAQSPPPGETAQITVAELKAKLADDQPVVIIDVRGADYDKSEFRIKKALRIPPAELHSRMKELPREAEIVTYCACPTDGGAVKAALALQSEGFKRVRVLKGGWTAWNESNGPVERK